jgi:hypothetical protein
VSLLFQWTNILLTQHTIKESSLLELNGKKNNNLRMNVVISKNFLSFLPCSELSGKTSQANIAGKKAH